MSEFSHLDKAGKATMVDVSTKAVTHRTATARSIVYLPDEVLTQLVGGDLQTRKVQFFKPPSLPALWLLKNRRPDPALSPIRLR
ncbi:cyclic pyranopterin monophosphate synthase MoaC [Mucilaginibacter humi]|uniref:cyclic pyranopterin monophosphate synthase MoaC n=1 Tax=Mucilaginibacter humi TaxID=2732510 RepID=UPI0021D33997|nr:cyclic pyranopterin monophosphate synthase MoaC [Mucilaginibacter humi]